VTSENHHNPVSKRKALALEVSIAGLEEAIANKSSYVLYLKRNPHAFPSFSHPDCTVGFGIAPNQLGITLPRSRTKR
jgi:hypothetical protein